MTLWQDFSEMFRRDARRYQAFFLPNNRVSADYDTTPIKAGEAYCRLWLVEMCLAKDTDWFKQRYPIVHAAVRFHHGTKPLTVPYLAQPGQLQEIATENLDRVIQCNYPLTPLFPFNQGLVELQAGLFSMEASDSIGKFIKTMGRFSEILPVPELSSVLKLIEPVYRGIEDLVSAGKGQLELGYQQTYSPARGGGDNDLKAGYFGVILAEEKQINPNNLCVANDSLRVESSPTQSFTKNSKPLEGYSYMLFRVEKQPEQDWESLSRIKELVNKAQELIFQGEYEEVKNTLIPAIRTTIYSSPDVAKADRSKMIIKIEDYFKEIGLEGQAIQKLSLYSIMQRNLPEIDSHLEKELAKLEKFLG